MLRYRFTMLSRFSFVFIFVCTFKAHYAFDAESNLETVVNSATNFFEQLKHNYESRAASPELYESIDSELADYVKNVSKLSYSSRGKRQLDSDKDIAVLNGFERVPGLDLPNALDVSFFVHRNGPEQIWYAAALNRSGISLLKYQDRSFDYVGSCELHNGTRIISHSCESATLLVVQRSIGDVLVIRLSSENSEQTLHKVQTLDTPSASHSTLWRGMKEIYLAVASPKNLTIFKWLDEHFDRIPSQDYQTDSLGAKKIIPFQIGSSMHLIAVNGPRTSVLKFLLHSDEFVVIQKLVGAKDATAFHLRKARLGENFLALAGQRSTIIYKQSRHRFVPFQEISSADEIRSLTYDAAVLLLLIKNGEITIYQYDGWRFVESSVRISGTFDVVPLSLKCDELLALKLKDTRVKDNFSDGRSNADASFSGTNNAPPGQFSSRDFQRFGDSTKKILDDNRFGEDGRAATPKDDDVRYTTRSWSFYRIMWRRKKSWTSLREETKKWCQSSLDKTLRVAAPVPQFKGFVRIEQGYIENLRVREVNGQSVEKLAQLNERWDTIVDETRQQGKAIKNYISRIDPTFENLRAGTVRVNCTTTCRAKRTETATELKFFEHLRRVDKIDQNLDFRNVKVSFLKNNLPCPIPALTFDDVTVSGLVNGIHFPAFVNDVLRTTGNQTLTGSHTFAELRVTNAKVPLDVASNYTRQDIVAETVKIEQLNINEGGLFLSSNGGNAVLSGSLTVPKAKINGLIDLRGRITGKGAEIFSPMIHITEPLELYGNFTLQNVKVVENLEVNDLTRSKGKTFNEIISNAVPLNADHVPVHFKFRNDRVSWKNMTMLNFPYKWLTKKHTDHVIITGTKRATMSNINLGKLASANLPTPRLPSRLCAVTAISDDIWESNLTIDRASANTVRSINVFDESEFSEVYTDFATSLNEVSWSLKNLTGRITVNEAKINKIEGMNYRDLNKSVSRWIGPGRLKGPVNVQNLNVNHLSTPFDLKVSLPLEVGNAESTKNVYVEKLNGVNFTQFLDNIVNIEDTMSLTNVTFAGGLVAREIFASQTSFYLQEKEFDYMGSKEIAGTLESAAIIVPHVLHFPSSNIPVNIITNGNVTFANEPRVVNVNDKNLEDLYDKIWMTDRATTISAQFIEFENVSFLNDLTISKSFDTPNLGPWNGIENRLLSKKKSQRISVQATFSSIAAPNVFGAAQSHLRSNISYLNDLELNSLKKNDTQVIKNKWNFEELIVTENVDLRGRINNLKLATDVVRYDMERNLITGKKTVRDLTARNIDGLEFGKFARNALRKNNGNRPITVKGWKTFKTVQMQDVRVDGTIMGSRIESSLLKSSAQSLRGAKTFQGTLTTPEILTNGTINDINLKYLTDFQLKKRADSQTIRTPMALLNNLTILGNLTVDGLYQGVELRNLKNVDSSHKSVVTRTTELLDFAEGIDVALENRAVYWHKLELLEKNSMPLISDPVKNELVTFDGLGRCRIDRSSLYCNNEKVFDLLSTVANGTQLLQAGVVRLSGIALVACVTSDPEGGIFIYQFDHNDNRFHQIAALRVPGIIAGSFTTTMDCLWISIRLLDNVMILRYELWARNFQEWILPDYGDFLMSSTPTEELLILRSDGVWRLGGLAGPHHVFHARLSGQIDTFSIGPDYYVQLTDGNVTTLLKTRYIGG